MATTNQPGRSTGVLRDSCFRGSKEKGAGFRFYLETDAGEEAEFTEAISHRDSQRTESLVRRWEPAPAGPAHGSRGSARTNGRRPIKPFVRVLPLDPCPRVARSHRLADYGGE